MHAALPQAMEGRLLRAPKYGHHLATTSCTWRLWVCKQGIGFADAVKVVHRLTWTERERRTGGTVRRTLCTRRKGPKPRDTGLQELEQGQAAGPH